MAKLAWEAAEDEYQKALNLDKNNKDADIGLEMAQVFKPEDGQQNYSQEIVDTKLDQLLTDYPDSYEVYFMKALSEEGKPYSHPEEVAKWIHLSLEKKKDFTMGYVKLGGVYQRKGKIVEAIKEYKHALDIEPNNSYANDGIGTCYLEQKKFTEAEKALFNAYHTSAALTTFLSLGDARLFSDSSFAAEDAYDPYKFTVDQIAKAIANPKLQNDEQMNGTWFYNYFPSETTDDQKKGVEIQSTININNNDAVMHMTGVVINGTSFVVIDDQADPIYLYEIEEKYAFALYNLSFAYAMKGDFDNADKYFDEANKQKKNNQFFSFFVNKMYFIIRQKDLDAETQDWFVQHILLLK